MFTSAGIAWTDGNESFGQNPAPFEACPPPMSGGVGSPTDPLGGLGGNSDSMGSSSSEVEEQLALTQNPQSNSNNPNAEGSVLPNNGTNPTSPPLFVNNGDAPILVSELDILPPTNVLGTSSVAPITGQTFIPGDLTPTYLQDAPPEGSREAILNKFRGTGDIAGAMEALANENSLAYDQTTPQDINKTAKTAQSSNPLGPSVPELKEMMEARFVGTASNEELIHATRANCYETVHFAAWFAGSGTGAMPQITGGLTPLVDPRKMTEWDGGEIPRGQIIIGTTSETLGGQDQYGFYHVAVSLGNGLVANNRGSGIQIEKLEDVFGGIKNDLFYNEIYFGDYDGYKLPESGREFLIGARENNNDVIQSVTSLSPGELVDMFGGSPEGESTLSPEQAQALGVKAKEVSTGQNEIIDAALGISPYPRGDDFSDEMVDYNRFVVQVMEGVTGNKSFFYTDYNKWQAAQEQEAETESSPQIASTPKYEPPSQNAGYENMSQFFVEAFGAAETAGLSTPEQQ